MRLVLVLLSLQFGCRDVPELEPVQAPEPMLDACDDCWDWCGDEDSHVEVIYCTNLCNEVCA